MAIGSSKHLKPGVGLDIGSHSIKVVELQPGRNGWSLGGYGHQVVPKSMAETAGNEDMLAGLIRMVCSRNNIKTKSVYLVLSSYNVLVRKATLPKMPDEELVEAIKWDARESMMFSPEDAVVDHYLLGETTQEGLQFDEVLAVIAPRQEVERLVDIAVQAGIRVEGILPHPLALEAYDELWVEDVHKEDLTTCFVDMGHQRTRVYFVTGVEILFSREIPNGGINITQALVGEYQTHAGRTAVVDEKRAEEIKLRYGLPPADTEEETHDRIPAREFRDRILPVITRQVEEIERSIDSFGNSYIMTTVERVVFTGGGTGLRGFLDYARQHMELTVSSYNPLAQLPASGNRPTLEDDAAEIGHNLVAAAGCAVGQSTTINLLPEELRRSFAKTMRQMARLAPIPIALLLLIAFSLYLRLDLHDKEQNLTLQTRHLNELKQRLMALEIPKRQLEQLQKQKQNLLEEQALLPDDRQTPVNLPEVLNEIARRVTANMALEQVTFSEFEGRRAAEEKGGSPPAESKGLAFLLKGTIFGSREKVLNTLETFLKELKKSPRLADVKLLESQVTDKDKYTRRGIDFTVFISPALRPHVT